MEQLTDMKYLKLLAHEYPTIAEVSTEIINLKAILGLPKGTEHFISGVHPYAEERVRRDPQEDRHPV